MIKFCKTYNYIKVTQIMHHPDIYNQLTYDQLPDEDVCKQLSYDWICTNENYLIYKGAVLLGALTVSQLDKHIVEIHGGVFKAGFGKLSRQILNEFMNYLKEKQHVRSVYMFTPKTKIFVKKLLQDTNFSKIDEFETNLTKNGEEVIMYMYRREL